MRRQIEHPIYQTLQLKELIGRGSYGHIYKAVSTPSLKVYAVKVIGSDADPDALPKIQKEIKILMSSQHQNIVKCHSVEIVDDGVWIVMDYCEGGSLADIMRRNKSGFNEGNIKTIMAQILKALAYLHSNKIMHRDIKAANILVNKQGEIKVADFGVSTIISHTQTGRNTKTGSPFWMSPELLSKSQYSLKTDIWSLGITAIQLAEGAPPYSHQHPYRAIFSIQSNPPNSLSDPQQWSPQFNDFVRQCLTVDVSHRPSAQQLLSHPFFHKNTQNFIVLDENKCMEQSIEQQQSINNSRCGTVVLHHSRKTSVWQKEKQKQDEKEQQQNYFGTMMINTSQNGGLQTYVIEKFTQADENVAPNFEINTMNSQKCSVKQSPIAEVQLLYAKMEQEIAQIRNKYFTKIRQIEEKSSPTFSQMLKNKKMCNINRN